MHVRARTHTPAQTGANNAGASIIYDSFEFRVSRLSRALLPIFVLGERGIEWLLSKWMYCRRENGLRFSHTGTASLTVPRSVSTGFVNHARLTDHSARHKALASCKETPLLSSVSPPIWQLDSSVTMVSLVSLRKKKKRRMEGRERSWMGSWIRLEVVSISIESWMDGKMDGWLEFFCPIYITSLLSIVKKNHWILWNCKVVEEKDNAIANYSDDSFQFLVPWNLKHLIDRCLLKLCEIK